MKESLKRLHTMCFHDMLEKIKLWRQQKKKIVVAGEKGE